MRLFENIILTQALLSLGAALEHEIKASRRATPNEKQKTLPTEKPPMTRQQRRAAARHAKKGGDA
jgi:ribosome recycling factor